jgi:hypothetical protein
MNRKRLITALCLGISLAIGSLAFAAQSEATANIFGFEIKPREIFQKIRNIENVTPLSEEEKKQIKVSTDQNASRIPPQPTQYPEEVMYFFLFKKLESLEDQARRAESEGRSPDNYRKHFIRKISLTESENELLKQIATNCLSELEAMDVSVREIVRRAHEDLKRNPPRRGNPPPLPPAELTVLQRQRENTILRFRDSLKTSLGNAKFNQLHAYLRSQVVKKVTTPFEQSNRPPAANMKLDSEDKSQIEGITSAGQRKEQQ